MAFLVPSALPMAGSERSPPSASQVLLGLFVMGQLLYLLIANAINLNALTGPRLDDDEHEERPALGEAGRTALERARRLSDAWANLTLQTQHWGLFWEFPPRSPFPAVCLRWHD